MCFDYYRYVVDEGSDVHRDIQLEVEVVKAQSKAHRTDPERSSVSQHNVKPPSTMKSNPNSNCRSNTHTVSSAVSDSTFELPRVSTWNKGGVLCALMSHFNATVSSAKEEEGGECRSSRSLLHNPHVSQWGSTLR